MHPPIPRSLLLSYVDAMTHTRNMRIFSTLRCAVDLIRCRQAPVLIFEILTVNRPRKYRPRLRITTLIVSTLRYARIFVLRDKVNSSNFNAGLGIKINGLQVEPSIGYTNPQREALESFAVITNSDQV
jgi:hypothetical protein